MPGEARVIPKPPEEVESKFGHIKNHEQLLKECGININNAFKEYKEKYAGTIEGIYALQWIAFLASKNVVQEQMQACMDTALTIPSPVSASEGLIFYNRLSHRAEESNKLLNAGKLHGLPPRPGGLPGTNPSELPEERKFRR